MHYRWMIEIDAHRVCVKTVPGNFSCCCWFCFSFSLFADFFGTLYSRVTSKIDGVCLVGVCMHCVQYVLIYERTHTHIQTGLMWTILSIDLWCLPIIFDTAIRTRLLYHIIIGIRRWVCVCVHQIIKRRCLGARTISANILTPKFLPIHAANPPKVPYNLKWSLLWMWVLHWEHKIELSCYTHIHQIRTKPMCNVICLHLLRSLPRWYHRY